MKKKLRNALVAPVAIVLIIVSAVSIKRSWYAPKVGQDMRPFEAAGRVLAQQTVRTLGGSGRVVLWRLRYAVDNPMLTATSAAFDEALRQTPGVVVAAIEEELYNPYEPMEGMKKTAVNPDRFLELVARHKDADALVLVGTMPNFKEADFDRMPAARPKIIAASLLFLPPRAWLQRHAADVVIAPRQGDPPAGPDPQTPDEWFARWYVVVTPENAECLP